MTNLNVSARTKGRREPTARSARVHVLPHFPEGNEHVPTHPALLASKRGGSADRRKGPDITHAFVPSIGKKKH
jgi:hypothetical protein